jgi:hypothetical protein
MKKVRFHMDGGLEKITRQDMESSISLNGSHYKWLAREDWNQNYNFKNIISSD